MNLIGQRVRRPDALDKVKGSALYVEDLAVGGALIAGVLRGGPADKAGVKPGDVLLEVEGKPVADPTTMLNLIAALAPGRPAKMKLKRQDKEFEATITVGRRPKPQARAE